MNKEVVFYIFGLILFGTIFSIVIFGNPSVTGSTTFSSRIEKTYCIQSGDVLNSIKKVDYCCNILKTSNDCVKLSGAFIGTEQYKADFLCKGANTIYVTEDVVQYCRQSISIKE